MRSSNFIENTAVVYRRSDSTFLGTAFIFRYSKFLLTADHVVKELVADNLYVEFSYGLAQGKQHAVRRIISHGKADLAVLEIDPPNEQQITWPFTEAFNDNQLGLDVISFGASQEFDSSLMLPVSRIFKGHTQRFFLHNSYKGYEYMAVELSFPCPGGLSGACIVNPEFQGRLYGIITENRKTTTEIESVVEVSDDGKEYRESFHNIVNYGIALWLEPYSKWVDAIIPPIPAAEISRRSQNQHKWLKGEIK